MDDEEFEHGLKCIAAPVRDFSGGVVASISVAGPNFRLTEDKISVLAASVVEVANQLASDLGYREAKPFGRSNRLRQDTTKNLG